jgi:hypothetical protein
MFPGRILASDEMFRVRINGLFLPRIMSCLLTHPGSINASLSADINGGPLSGGALKPATEGRVRTGR